MFDIDDDTPVEASTLPESQKLNPDQQKKADELAIQRHSVLMQCFRDEGELQAEERQQMAIDDDYNDHLQWRAEDAMELMDRGQAPIVYNEGRQTIEWVCGMQKRMRSDYKILPRERGDEEGAEAKTKVFKYVSDVNLTAWHESRAFKQAVVSGLGWLEEGINTDPGKEQIFSGSESWRNVLRDSRDLSFDLEQSRYLFRKKRTDLDYACALLPHARAHLKQQATSDLAVNDDIDDPWYLGERLTGATDLSGIGGGVLPGRYRDRAGFIGGPQAQDRGRRLSVDLLEAWYRVPEAVQVFSSGPLKGKEYDPKNPGHQQLEQDRWRLYAAVVQRMRVQIATPSAPVWDGKSPMKHNRFLLVPVWGYRRGRDGQAFGLWRGMRDTSDTINKQASKLLYIGSSNRVVYKQGSIEDPEVARQEAARPDMFLAVQEMDDIRFEKATTDAKLATEQIALNREMLRNQGGVTQANLGQDSRAVSGKAIGLQQDQGGLVTSEFPDNMRLAKQLGGRLRLSHIEQFMTERQVIRIVGEASPIEWLTINDQQEDGTTLNDITSKEADFIIAERDYRESYAQAAMESMMELLSKIGAYAPELVLNVLDLVVEEAEISNKDEWVSRIRKLSGQRDPRKKPTPEELQAQQEAEEEAKQTKQIQMGTLQAGLDKLRAEVGKLDTEAILKRVESMFSALQAAQIVALNPTVAPVGDTIAQGAGFKDQNGDDPNLPVAPAMPGAQGPAMQPGVPPMATEQPMPPQGAMPADAMPPQPQALEGVTQGIQTPTGADNGPAV